MNTKPRIKSLEEVPLTPSEQAIEDAIDENAPLQPLSSERKAEFQAAARAALVVMRGGKRPGSGRKSRAYVKTTVLLAPDVRGKLEILAKQAGSLSAAVEKAIMAQPV
jgi:hypothetical protein